MKPLLPGWLFIVLMLMTFYVCAIAIADVMVGR